MATKKRLVKRLVNTPYQAFYPWYWGTGYGDIDYDLDENSP